MLQVTQLGSDRGKGHLNPDLPMLSITPGRTAIFFRDQPEWQRPIAWERLLLLLDFLCVVRFIYWLFR